MSAVQQMLMGAGGGATDPYYANVSLLLHMDGSNGSTTFTDNSPSPKTVTPAGNASTNTSIVKYGTASAAFDGTGDYLTVPDNVAFGYGTADFTIELWLYKVGSTSFQTILSNVTFISDDKPMLYFGSGDVIVYYTGGGNRIISDPVSLNTWNHIAVSRASGSVKLFVNGIQNGSTWADTTDCGTSAPLGIGTYWTFGSPYSLYHLSGYVDDVRITKGIARYTANFTPPTGPFPNS